MLIVFNGSIWVPQIIRSYWRRSRFGPDTNFVYLLTLSHIFLPAYIHGCPSNMFDREPDYLFVLGYLLYQFVQINILLSQKVRNPRFFVPKKWRLNRNAYNYFQRMPKLAPDPTASERID